MTNVPPPRPWHWSLRIPIPLLGCIVAIVVVHLVLGALALSGVGR